MKAHGRINAIVSLLAPLMVSSSVVASELKSRPILPASSPVLSSPPTIVTPSPPTASPAASSMPILRESIVKEGGPTAPEDNSVESFFQCGPTPAPGDQRDNSNHQSTGLPLHRSSREVQQKSSLRAAGRIVWHILDNIGVPMFVGKDRDLDPSIDRSNWMPPPTVSTKVTALKKMEQSSASAIPESAGPSTSQGNGHKIPESELEGVELPAPKDASTP